MPTRALPPPPEWNKSLTDPKERYDLWDSLGFVKRNIIKSSIKRSARSLERAQKAVADGTASRIVARYAAQIPPAKHATPEIAAAAKYATTAAYRVRIGLERLEFRRHASLGCVIENCPLTQPPPGHPRILFSLLEHDHRNKDEKMFPVLEAGLSLQQRLQELPKTDCKCLWHHFLHTSKQMKIKTVTASENRRLFARLAKQKLRSGCQHPLHDRMPYAMLIDQENETRFAFFEVSHIHRGSATARLPRSTRAHRLNDLAAGIAVVHCRFCHRLYTLCERAMLSPSAPHTQYELEMLRSQFPAFVADFESNTSDFDWDAERDRLSKNASEKKKAYWATRKRKRGKEPEESSGAWIGGAPPEGEVEDEEEGDSENAEVLEKAGLGGLDPSDFE